MEIFMKIILILMIILSVSVSLVKDIVGGVIMFTAYSLLMAILWQQLNAPDLAITEAAVGAGITTLLFVAAIRHTKRK